METVRLGTGKRESIYEAADEIWQAKYGPDGSSIAFLMIKAEPGSSDDEPDCRSAERDLWVLALDSRKEVGTRWIAHFNVTRHPTAAWTFQQLREVVMDDQPY